MRIEKRYLSYSTTAGTDIVDLTANVERFVADAGIQDGTLLVFVPGSTAAITTIELESGALADLAAAVERLAPSDATYQHNLRWHDGNGYAHVRAALMGPSLSVPVLAGKLLTGSWQQIVLCDFDNRPRQRKVFLQVTGE